MIETIGGFHTNPTGVVPFEILKKDFFKKKKLPKILEEYSKERSAVPYVKPHNFVHPDDSAVLEDDSGRVNLGCALLSPSGYAMVLLKINSSRKGVVALHGKKAKAGEFLVEDVLEAGLPPQLELPLRPDRSCSGASAEDKYVVLVSGHSVGNSACNPLLYQLLVDHITGHLGDKQEQGFAAEIVHAVLAGNSIEVPGGLLHRQTLASGENSGLSNCTKELDILLTQIAAALPVDILPGPDDPANFVLPQQPLNDCLFPGSSKYNTLRSCPNPHFFKIDNIRLLITSGQNIDDLENHSEAKDRLEFMERTLRWRHLAPTAPNTLGCYPYTDRDPFLIEACPHVYFAGNQDKYGTGTMKGQEGQLVRLIFVPKFCETGVAVMLNLRNLECHALSLGASL